MNSPRLLLLLGLLLAGLVVSALLTQQQGQRFVPLTTYSTQLDGARALALWLEESGYQVARLEDTPYAVDPSVQLLFVLEPSLLFEPAQLDTLDAWVRQGGVLVLAGNRLQARPLLQRFGVHPQAVAPAVERSPLAQPLLLGLPVGQVVLRAPDVLDVQRSDAVPILATDEAVLAASVEIGKGRVIALASPLPFTNAGLALGDNAAFAVNLVSLALPGATIGFDEYHHGFIQRGQQTALDLTVRSPWGWAAAYAGAVVLAYLALSGRRFGRAVPLAVERRRSVAEYVRSMASLYRRAGKRRFIARHHAQQIRRRLARELGLDPSLPCPELAEWLRRRGLARDGLLSTVERLEAESPLGERELVDLVQKADGELAFLAQRSKVGG